MNILFVCHSIDDTNAVLATAREILEQSQDNLIFLSIGQAAKRFLATQIWFNEYYSRIKVWSLADIFNEEIMLSLENSGFSAEQRIVMKQFLQFEQISRALIGTPSELKALTAFEIGEDLTSNQSCRVCILYNYLYIEADQPYQTVVSDQNSAWTHLVMWFLPLPAAQLHLNNINPRLRSRSVVVGDPTLDFFLGQANPPAEAINEAHAQLNVLDQQPLLFISGSKDKEADVKLLEGLLTELKKRENAGIVIRIGIHPGIEDKKINEYVAALQEIIDQLPPANENDNRVKIVINNHIADKGVDPVLLRRPSIVRVTELSNDQACAIADGTASAQPATLCYGAALGGRPSYCHGKQKSFIDVPHVYVGQENMPLLFNQLRSRARAAVLTRTQIGIPEESSSKVMASKLLGN
jgi:hypothetical protein